MARPANPVKFERASKQVLSVALLTATERSERRLQALLALYEGQSRQQAAGIAKVSLRTLQRWLKLFNTRGLQGLTTVLSPGRKVSLLELDSKLLPLIGSSPTRVSVAKVRKQLAQTHQIHLTYTTLQRYLTRLGYRPKDRIHQPPSTEGEWTKPWPRAYGESLADYLSK